MKKETTEIPLNYVTLKTTKSRINKGLLAIPVSLIDIFPKDRNKIHLIDEFGNEEPKKFTPYSSSSRECRIGGLKNFYDKFKVKDGDELIIQLIDDGKFRLLPEKYFKKQVLNSLSEFEKSETERIADEKLNIISSLTNTDKTQLLKNEFVRLSKTSLANRKTRIVAKGVAKESVPYSLRKILQAIYLGKCQISNFTFIMKNGKPYFEIHHIDPKIGNHFKNLLVVCPNTHAQFTYAEIEQTFDKDSWLRKVKFNNEEYSVYQAIDTLPSFFEKEVHF